MKMNILRLSARIAALTIAICGGCSFHRPADKTPPNDEPSSRQTHHADSDAVQPA